MRDEHAKVILAIDGAERCTRKLIDWVKEEQCEGVASSGDLDVLLDWIIDAREATMDVIRDDRERAALKRIRTARAYKRLRAGGMRTGQVPYGFELDESDRLRRCEREVVAVNRAVHLRDQGASFRAITEDLNEHHRDAARGSGWYITTVSRLVKRREGASREDT
jgi:hypothetical protein